MRHGLSRARGLLAAALLGILLPLGSAGCAAERPRLTLTSLSNHQSYEQRFTSAYAARTPEGVDVVLASDESAGGKGDAANLRQIMHVRVLWSPDRAVKVDGPASTNASIHWYVFAGGGGRTDWVEYTGTGLVTLDPDGDTTKVVVRNAALAPVGQPNGLHDPVGSTRFEGKVVARVNGRRVADLLAEARTTLAAAKIEKTNEAAQASARTE